MRFYIPIEFSEYSYHGWRLDLALRELATSISGFSNERLMQYGTPTMIPLGEKCSAKPPPRKRPRRNVRSEAKRVRPPRRIMTAQERRERHRRLIAVVERSLRAYAERTGAKR